MSAPPAESAAFTSAAGATASLTVGDVLSSLPAELDDLQPGRSSAPLQSNSLSLNGLRPGVSAPSPSTPFNLHPQVAIPASASISGTSGASAAPRPASAQQLVSSIDLPRSSSASWQPTPADGILQSSKPFLGASGSVQNSQQEQQAMDSGLPRVGSAPFVQGSTAGGAADVGVHPPPPPQFSGHTRSHSQPSHGLQANLANLTPAQQQILQQHLLMQQQHQQQQKVMAGQNKYNHVGNLQAAAQAAAFRQQSLLRQTSGQASGHANQNSLLQQALLGQNQNGNAALLQQQQTNAALLNAMAGQRGLGLGGGQQQQQQQFAGGYNGGAHHAPRQQHIGGGSNGSFNPALASALLNGQLHNNAAALQAFQAQQNLQNAQQQLLLNQTLGSNSMQGGGPGSVYGAQRSASQLQSEALIAMQRQNSGGHGIGNMRVNGGGAGGGTIPGQDQQLAAMAQLGLLGQAAGTGDVMGNGVFTPQQQSSALFSALYANGNASTVGMGAGLNPGQQHRQQQHVMQQQQQQQRYGNPAGMQRSNLGVHHHGLGANSQQQSLLAAALASQQQHQHPGMRYGGIGLAGQQQQQQQAVPGFGGVHNNSNNSGFGAAGSTPSGRTGGGDVSGGVDPIQTLQDIGRTLSQLGITVEAAVNAGLLGGLSASDVRIVAEAHRIDVDVRAGNTTTSSGAAPLRSGGSLPVTTNSASGSFVGGIGIGSYGSSSIVSGGMASAPNPSSPTNSVGGASTASAPAMRPSTDAHPTGGDGCGRAASAPASTADDDEADRLLLEIDEQGSARTRTNTTWVDEAALKAKVEGDGAAFDAAQYGFFGSSSNGGGAVGDGDLGIEDDDVVGGGLSTELDAKLTLGGAPGHAALMRPQGSGAAEKKDDAQGQSAASSSSVWGSDQGDRADAFGSYLAGLRLGTGF